jgi:hypothetical protein
MAMGYVRGNVTIRGTIRGSNFETPERAARRLRG